MFESHVQLIHHFWFLLSTKIFTIVCSRQRSSHSVMKSSKADGKGIDFAKTFKIILKDTQKQYTYHTDPFCTESLFFTSALKDGFKEGQHQEVSIGEEKDEESLESLMAWVYAGKKVFKHAKDGWRSATLEDLDVQKLTKLYILADYLLIPNLKNDIVDRFRKSCASVEINMESVDILLDRGPDDCALKNFMVDEITYHYKLSILDSEVITTTKPSSWIFRLWNTMEQSHELTLLVTRSLFDRRDRPSSRRGCYYHEHPEGFKSCEFWWHLTTESA